MKHENRNSMSNVLQTYFEKNNKRVIRKWEHYFEIYERYFNKYRNKEVSIMEVGVSQGRSLQMWKDYFGPKAKIYGIDINPECKKLEEDQIEIFIGSQSDRIFLNNLKKQIPKLDILLDDGGHTMDQQIINFQEMFDHIKDNGIYFCEDCHTSYWKGFGGGYKKPNSFIEYTKDWIDALNAWHSREPQLRINKFTESTFSLHYYDSIVVLEKRVMKPPTVKRTGNITVKSANPN